MKLPRSTYGSLGTLALLLVALGCKSSADGGPSVPADRVERAGTAKSVAQQLAPSPAERARTFRAARWVSQRGWPRSVGAEVTFSSFAVDKRPDGSCPVSSRVSREL